MLETTLRRGSMSRSGAGATHPSSRVIVKMAALPVAIAFLAVTLTGVALRGSASALKADIDVQMVGDPEQLGATTQADVQVRNREDHDIQPRFSVSWVPYPFYWNITSGPPRLGPGESAVYHIEAPDSSAAPPNGQAFQIKLNDASSIVYRVASPIEIPAASVAIINPGLRSWVQQDFNGNLVSPSGWNIYSRRGSDDVTSIEEEDVFGTHAARLHVVQGGAPDPGGWSHTGLVQDVPFPHVPLEIKVLTDAPYKATDTGWPLTAFGIEVTSGGSDLLWLLFQPTGRGDLDYSLPTGHRIHVYDVASGRWERVHIDLTAIYQRLGWVPSPRATFKLFAAAADTEPSDVQGFVAGIGVAAEGTQPPHS